MFYKKKYHGGLKLLFLLLFIMLLSTFSTCYASVSEEYVAYCLNRLNDNAIVNYNQSNFNNYLNNYLSNSSNITNLTNNINNRLNNHSWNNLTDINMICFVYSYNDGRFKIIFNISNQTAPGEYTNVGFIQFLQQDNIHGNIKPKGGYNLYIYLEFSTSKPNGGVSEYFTQSTNEYFDYAGAIFNHNVPSLDFPYNVYNYVGTQNAFYNNLYYLISNDNNTYQNYINNLPIEPEEPSGDTPIDSGLGNITNSSGESGGNINLQPIQQGLTNIQNQISGDTQKIIDNQKTLLSQILSFSGDYVLNDINGIRDIEFDLGNAVVDYQTRFFSGSPSGDIVFQWNGISLFNTPLIPSGDFNISAMIRENEQLGKLHHIIQVFSISSFGILLIAGYWNLLLATIGAGSHFLVETTTESDSLEDNASIDEFSHAIDDYNYEQRVASRNAERDKYYRDIVAKARADLLRKAGRK